MNIEKLAQYILNNKNFLMSEAKEQLIVDMESLKTDEQNGIRGIIAGLSLITI